VKVRESKLYKLSKTSVDNYWVENKNKIKYTFSLHLFQYAAGKFYDYNNNIHNYDDAISYYRKSSDGNRSSSKSKQFQRLLLGYNIINLTPKRSGLSTRKANEARKNKKTGIRCVNDHIIGVTTIGERVKNEIDSRLIKELKIKNDNDPYKYLYELKKDKWFLFVVKVVDDMANNWLPRNLILWAQCNVTEEQHKKSSIRRDEKNFFKKLNFEHYSEDIIIEKYH